MGIRADQYFWFDGVEDVDQANWGRFWRGFIPDGVIVGFGQNLMVSANSSGMHVQVAAGEAMFTAFGYSCKPLKFCQSNQPKHKIESI